MAAPCVFHRALQMRQVLSHSNFYPAIITGQLQQVRFKKGKQQVKKGTAPTEQKSKENQYAGRKAAYVKREPPKGWEKVLNRVPTDDVYVRRFYGRPLFEPAVAIAMHRELAQPDMLDNMDGLLHLDCDLNLRTNKKTKFQGTIKKTLLLPHPFDDGTENRVMAFCRTQEEKEAALAAGAVFAGGVELVKSIEQGEVRNEDFDQVVCTIDMITDIAKIRKQLKDNFPNKQIGSLGTDIAELTSFFLNGRTYESKKEREEHEGQLRVTLGPLSMPTEHLVANMRAYVDHICTNQKAGSPGQYITSAILVCPPSTERLSIQRTELKSSIAAPAKKKGKRAVVVEEEVQGEEEEEEPLAATA